VFESIFKNTAADAALTTTDVSLKLSSSLLCILVALLLGLVISIVYLSITPKNSQSPNLALSLVVLPTIVAVVILLIGSNIARAFSMAGVFALVRFRSIPGDSKDVTFVFMTVAAGLSAGLGYITFGAALTIILCLTVFIISKLGFGVSKQDDMRLRIIIPEDMNYQGAFDDLFDKYTKHCKLHKVRTTNLGTLFELTYHVTLKDTKVQKEFIDELRSRNGNLNIQLNTKESNDMQL
jgi:hypothetical protein